MWTKTRPRIATDKGDDKIKNVSSCKKNERESGTSSLRHQHLRRAHTTPPQCPGVPLPLPSYLEDVSVELGVLVADSGALLREELVLGQHPVALIPHLLQVLRQRGDLVQLPLTAVLCRQLWRGDVIILCAGGSWYQLQHTLCRDVS